MTPEEFLQQQADLQEIGEGLAPFFAVIANIRKGFVDDVGMGYDAADTATIYFCQTVIFPMLSRQAEVAA
jgi:hypothetical protein